MNTSLLRIGVVLIASAVLGAVSARVHQFPWIPDVTALHEREEFFVWMRQERAITLDELRAAILAGAVLIDARDRSAYEEEHLLAEVGMPTLNIPPDDQIDDHLERLHLLQGLPMVFYCNSTDCDLAEELCWELRQAGLFDSSDIRIFFPGWEELSATDLLMTGGPDEWIGFGAGMIDGEPDYGDTLDAETTTEP